MKKKDTRIGKGAPDLPGGGMNSEHESDAERIPPRSANHTPKDGSGPSGSDAGRKPHELRATSTTDFERDQEKKEGKRVARTPEEMSLHEEFDQDRKAKENQDVRPHP